MRKFLWIPIVGLCVLSYEARGMCIEAYHSETEVNAVPTGGIEDTLVTLNSLLNPVLVGPSEGDAGSDTLRLTLKDTVRIPVSTPAGMLNGILVTRRDSSHNGRIDFAIPEGSLYRLLLTFGEQYQPGNSNTTEILPFTVGGVHLLLIENTNCGSECFPNDMLLTFLHSLKGTEVSFESLDGMPKALARARKLVPGLPQRVARFDKFRLRMSGDTPTYSVDTYTRDGRWSEGEIRGSLTLGVDTTAQTIGRQAKTPFKLALGNGKYLNTKQLEREYRALAASARYGALQAAAIGSHVDSLVSLSVLLSPIVGVIHTAQGVVDTLRLDWSDTTNVSLTGPGGVAHALLVYREDTVFLRKYYVSRMRVDLAVQEAANYRILFAGVASAGVSFGEGDNVEAFSLGGLHLVKLSMKEAGKETGARVVSYKYGWQGVDVPVEVPIVDDKAGEGVRRFIESLPRTIMRSDGYTLIVTPRGLEFSIDTYNRLTDVGFNDGVVRGTYRIVGDTTSGRLGERSAPAFRIAIATARYDARGGLKDGYRIKGP